MTQLYAALSFSAAALLALAPPAPAQQPWQALGDVGHRAFIDTSAIFPRPGGLVVVRVRLADYVGAGIDRVETQEVNCRSQQSRVLHAEVWHTGERDLTGARQRVTLDTTWHRYAPGSLGGELLHAVCAHLQRQSPAP